MTATAPKHLRVAPAPPKPGRDDPLHARRRHLRLVRRSERAPRRRRRIVFAIVAIAAAATVFAIALVHVFMAQSAFELSRQEELLIERREENEDLELTVALKETPERIRREAKDRLGMVPPAGIHYLESRAADAADADDGVPSQPPSNPRSVAQAGPGSRSEAEAGDDAPPAQAGTEAPEASGASGQPTE